MKAIAGVTLSALLPALLAAAPVAAADLPVAVEPVDYVRVCEVEDGEHENGYFWIPGTETCLRIAGRIRADYNLYFVPDDDAGIFDEDGFEDADDRGYRFRARANLFHESRTNTEFGLLKTYLELELTYDSLDRGDGAPELDLSLEQAYIQFGGLSFGLIQSFFDYEDVAFSAAQAFDPAYSDNPTNVLAYTYEFGDVAATLSLEDDTNRRYGIAEGRYGGAQVPDVVGQLRWENDDIGSVQLMAAGHYVNGIGIVETNDPANRGPFRVTDEAYGYAVGGGVTLNVPFGNETKVGVLGAYAHGALSYLSVDIGAPYGVFDGAFGRGRGGRIGRDLELSDGFAVSGGFETSFTDKVSLGVNVGYLSVDAPEVDADFDEDGRLDDLDVQNLDVQGYLSYEPVSDFELGVGAEYRLIDTEDFGEGSVVTTFFRAQRAF